MKLHLRLLVLVGIASGVMIISPSVSADGSLQAPSVVASARVTLDPKIYTDWSWANTPWTGDDDAFAKARAKIDSQFKDVSDPRDAAAAYKNAAVDNPHNALEQFRWAYACYCARHGQNAHGSDVDTAVLLNALMHATQPHCYNYDRLLLLLMDNWPQERSLAERLLKRDSNDILVKYDYTEILVGFKDDADQVKAVKIAQDMVDAKEDVPGCYYNLGYICGNVAIRKKSAEYYQKAIDAFNQYLALDRSDDPRRPVIVHVNTYLENQLRKAQ